MKDTYIVCDNCGTECHADDVYCKTCSHPLADFTEQAIEGIDNQELRQFIGKNSEDYIKKFKKKKGDWFLQVNFAALFFGGYWCFYRKMYKVGILYTVAMLLLSLLLNVGLPMLFKGDVEAYYAAKEAYVEYDGEEYIYKDPPYSSIDRVHPDYQKVRDELVDAEKKVHGLNWTILLVTYAVNIFVRLFGNAFYKRHIRQNIGTGNGGTSVTAVVIGVVATGVVSNLFSILIYLIPVVRQFQEAAAGWYGLWM